MHVDKHHESKEKKLEYADNEFINQQVCVCSANSLRLFSRNNS